MTLTSETDYEILDAAGMMTPALVIYPEIVDANIAATLRVLEGDANRWRPHLKTAKLACIIRRLVDHGIVNSKCSTTLELATACQCGMKDVLVAYDMVGTNARRVRELAHLYGDTQISVLIENAAQIEQWSGSRIGLFVDLNPGMDRTGIAQERVEDIVRLARAIVKAGSLFRGLHYYDGHLHEPDPDEQQRRAHHGYDRLLEIVAALEQAGIEIGEIITSGTPAFPAAAAYWPFSSGSFIHRASPGTVVYNDCTSLTQLSADYGYRPAAIVLATVVSHPRERVVTCNAGHKSVSADAGVPTCLVLGRPDMRPLKPSEEHLPIEVAEGSPIPAIGDILYLVPRHVCPTVNNFDEALLVAGGRVIGLERVTARGHEPPIPRA